MNPLAWHKAIVDLIKYTPSPPPFWPMHQSDISKEGYYLNASETVNLSSLNKREF